MAITVLLMHKPKFNTVLYLMIILLFASLIAKTVLDCFNFEVLYLQRLKKTIVIA